MLGLDASVFAKRVVMPAPLYNALGEYVDLLLDAVCAVDREGRFEFLSTGAERIFGYSAAEMLGRSMLSFVHPADRAKTLEAARAINAGEIRLDFENRYIRKDGQVVHLLWSARWSADKQQRVAVARDISKLKQAEARQRALYAISEAAFAAEDLQALYRQLLHIVQQLMPISCFVIARLTPRGELQLPYKYLPGSAAQTELVAHDFCKTLLDVAVMPSGQPLNYSGWQGVVLSSHNDVLGALAVQIDHALAGASDAELLDFVGQHIAIAIERKELLARLHHYAMYDDLTQLPKRELFYDRCRHALSSIERNNATLAVCYLDLDGFKPVNDQYGHATGDALLQQIAGRLLASVRQTDTVARFGGDEFVVLLNQIESTAVVATIVDKIRLCLNQSFLINSHVISVTPSIGIALYPAEGASAEQLLALADRAMYQAKQQGGNCYVLASVAGPKCENSLTTT